MPTVHFTLIAAWIMTLSSALHLILHLLVPALVARCFFRRKWLWAFAIMMATMVVDLDHLIADPIYDPERCSIGFHPLHTSPAILAWSTLSLWSKTRLIGIGLMLHMALDFSDCVVQRGIDDAVTRLLATPCF